MNKPLQIRLDKFGQILRVVATFSYMPKYFFGKSKPWALSTEYVENNAFRMHLQNIIAKRTWLPLTYSVSVFNILIGEGDAIFVEDSKVSC